MFNRKPEPKIAEKPRGKPPTILYERTQKVIAQIESELKEPLLTYWNSPNGSICGNDVIGLYGILRSMGKVERLSLFIKSDGGYGQASLRIVNLLRQYVGQLTVVGPL